MAKICLIVAYHMSEFLSDDDDDDDGSVHTSLDFMTGLISNKRHPGLAFKTDADADIVDAFGAFVLMYLFVLYVSEKKSHYDLASDEVLQSQGQRVGKASQNQSNFQSIYVGKHLMLMW